MEKVGRDRFFYSCRSAQIFAVKILLMPGVIGKQKSGSLLNLQQGDLLIVMGKEVSKMIKKVGPTIFVAKNLPAFCRRNMLYIIRL